MFAICSRLAFYFAAVGSGKSLKPNIDQHPGRGPNFLKQIENVQQVSKTNLIFAICSCWLWKCLALSRFSVQIWRRALLYPVSHGSVLNWHPCAFPRNLSRSILSTWGCIRLWWNSQEDERSRAFIHYLWLFAVFLLLHDHYLGTPGIVRIWYFKCALGSRTDYIRCVVCLLSQ